MKGLDVYSLRLQTGKLKSGSEDKPWAFCISLVNCRKMLVGDVGLFCWCGTNGRINHGKAGLESAVMHGLF